MVLSQCVPGLKTDRALLPMQTKATQLVWIPIKQCKETPKV